MLTALQLDLFRRLHAWLDSEGWKDEAALIQTLFDEANRLRNAILSFGNNPAGFDWAVLGRIEELEAELAAARARCEGLAERVAKQSELLSRRAEKAQPRPASSR